MGKSAPETPLARRLRELAEEEKALQQQMKALARQARRLEDELPSGRSAPPPGPRVRGNVEPVEPPADPPPRSEVTAPEMDILMGEAPAAPTRGASAAARPVSPGYAATMPAARKPTAPPPERFANYFSSGSFGKARPLGYEKKLQRNKAIFMVIFVVLVGYVLYRVFF
jgi:hypothetical protein